MGRSYADRDLNLLWGLSAGRCNFPGCRTECIQVGNSKDDNAIIGDIAHIEAFSNDGPRANPNLTPKQRNQYDNLILLCATHHRLVDQQPNTYTAEELRKWKSEHEKWVLETFRSQTLNVTFEELEYITAIIAASPSLSSSNFNPTAPKEKMKKNDLTNMVEPYITMGLVRFEEVKSFVAQMARIQYDFPERLKAGFLSQYNKLKYEKGLHGDALFFEMMEFASNNNHDFLRKAAGVCVLTYLFHLCEVFEP